MKKTLLFLFVRRNLLEKSLLTLVFLITSSVLSSQNIAINSSGNPASTSAILDLSNSANMAFLAPQVVLTSATVLAPVPGTGPTGLIVYNTSSSLLNGLNGQGYYYWTGATGSPANTWLYLFNSGSSLASSSWALTGNAGTTPGINFAGTSDANDYVFRTRDTERMRVLTTGSLGFGTPAPKSSVDVNGSISIGTYAGVNAAPPNGGIVSGEVGIGTNTPNNSAMLDVTSTNSGFLPPRMTAAQMNAIVSPATGLLILNTTNNCLEYFNGLMWQIFVCPCSGPPATPGTITGNIAVCPLSAGNVYTIAAVPNTNYYSWTVPPGATITSGIGTPSITVTMGVTSGNVAVTAINSCGISAASILAVTVTPAPSAPAAIFGPTAICLGLSGYIYSIAPVVGASSYLWNVPVSVGTLISGQGTTSISVTAAGSPGSGNIKVVAINGCGVSPAASLNVTAGSSAAIILDTTVNANGLSTFSIITAHANELILIAADGWPGPFSGLVNVDGNAATALGNALNGNSGGSSVYGYLAPLAGSHTIAVTESGYNSPYYLNMAAAFTGGCSLSPAKTIVSTNAIWYSSPLTATVNTVNANNYLFVTGESNTGWNNPFSITFSGSVNTVEQGLHEGWGIDVAIGASSAATIGSYPVTVTDNSSCCGNTIILVGIEP